MRYFCSHGSTAAGADQGGETLRNISSESASMFTLVTNILSIVGVAGTFAALIFSWAVWKKQKRASDRQEGMLGTLNNAVSFINTAAIALKTNTQSLLEGTQEFQSSLLLQKTALEGLQEKIVELESLIPEELRIVVIADLTSETTKTWGQSVLLGIRRYFRKYGTDVCVADKRYRYVLDVRDDKGDPAQSASLLTNSVKPCDKQKAPLAVIGPISTTCAKAALSLLSTQGQLIPVLHLLPVSTGSDVFGVDGALRTHCTFRMPPNNEKQARTLVKLVKKFETMGPCHVFRLKAPRNKDYIDDLFEQFSAQWRVVFGNGTPMQYTDIENAGYLESSEFGKRANEKWGSIVAIGPWRADENRFPSVEALINSWRAKERINPGAKILLPDYAVPKMEDALRESGKPMPGVYATYQLRPEALDGVPNEITGAERYSSSFIQYGFDAAALVDGAVLGCSELSGIKLAEALHEMGYYEGRAQVYNFRNKDSENDAGKFHVFDFSTFGAGQHQRINHDKDFCVECR